MSSSPPDAATAVSTLVVSHSSGGARLAAHQAATVRARLDQQLAPLIKPYDMGVAVIDYRSGVRWGYRGGKTNSLASLVKVTTAMGVFLHAYDRGRSATAEERRWMRRSLQVSDNAAQTALWARIGRSRGYARTVSRLGLQHTYPHRNGSWGRALSTANDQAKVMDILLRRRSPLKRADAQWIVATMRGVSSGQTWGAAPFGRARGRTIEVKNGWSPYSDTGRWRLTSLGHIRDSRHDYVIAILSNGWSSYGSGVPALNRVGNRAYRVLAH